MPITVKPIVPAGAIVPSTKSSSMHIQRRRLVEIQPQAQVSYSYAGNAQLIFDVNSPSDFWEMTESYLRMNLTCALTNAGADAAKKYLAEGGAHCLFRTIEITTQSGTLIQRIERVNKLYSVMSSASHSKEYVDFALARTGDSWDIESVPSPAESQEWQDMTITTLTFDATGGASEQLVTGVGTAFLSDFQVGDFVYMADPAGADNAIIGRVGSITSDTVMNLSESSGDGNVDLAATATILKRLRPGRAADAVRKLAANTSGFEVCIQPFAPFLMMDNWFPLFLVRGGLRITLTMDRPEFCLAVPEEPAGVGFDGASVTVSNPVWVCSMVTPDESLQQQYLDMYKGDGIVYNFLGYRHYLDIQVGGGAQTYVSQINSNVRSAKHILTRIQNLRAETVTAGTVNSGKSTYTCDSIAQGLKAHLSQYQYKAGSERFPQARPIQMSDISNSEPFGELNRVMNDMGSVVHGKRMHPLQWQERQTYINEFEATQAADSQRLILSAELARDSKPWAGLDLSLNSLQGEFTFDAQYQITDKDGSSNAVNADRYLHHFLGYDQSLLLSDDEGVVVFS